MTRSATWQRLFVLALVLAGTPGCSTATTRCIGGAVVACACAGAVDGTQVCGADGTFGTCACGPSHCTPGALFACACSATATGTQTCDAAGAFGACTCTEPTSGPRCIPGASAACWCATGEIGAQTCSAAGVYDACVCMPQPARCIAGQSTQCSCDGFSQGVQLCGPDGSYLACDCGLLDAGTASDGGADAGPPICDPYVGATCGCPEAVPPTSPTLSPRPAAATVTTGSGALVDVFVTEAGIVLVTGTEVRLVSRAGAMLQRWTAPREIISAAYDGTRIVAVDRAAATTLDLSLTPGIETFVRGECVSSALVSCGRLVCGFRTSSGPPLETYDILTGHALWPGDGFFSGTPRLLRVRGVDALVTSGPPWGGYYRVNTDGTLAGAGGGLTSSPGVPWAFLGSPATHLVASDGALYRLDACIAAPTSGATTCFARDGSVGTLRAGEQLLATETGADGDLYALVGAPGSFGGPVCSSGCRVQRIDLATRTVRSEHAFVVGGTSSSAIVLRHDAWGGRVVVAAPTGCATSYPYTCSGWSVALAAFD
jgi:hypothetical protein